MIVIKVGGHLLFDDASPRTDYIGGLLSALRELTGRDKIVVVVGGGAVARKYISAGRVLGVGEGLLDLLGIRIARANAALLHAAYHKSPPVIPEKLEDIAPLVDAFNPVFMGGLQPGQSTTTVAALVAEALGASLYVATNVEGVYTEDPGRNPDARLLREVNVEMLRRMFAGPSGAGGYALLDPLTLNILERSRIPTLVFKGDPPENILRAVKKGDIGTRVKY